ncbi:MAG: hypothetical protein AAGD05_16380, partial [Bacteroidota bacterium]
MKFLFFFTGFFVTLSVSAQLKPQFVLYSQTGYEHNIFKAPPQEGDTPDLYSSAYQQVRLRSTFTKSWKNQQLRFRLTPKLRYFFTEPDAHYQSWTTQLRYRNKFSKKIKWQQTLRYRLIDREGTNAGDGAFITPLGYQHWNWLNQLDFRLYRKNRSQLKVDIGHRNYRDGESNDLKYHFIHLELLYKNVFKTKHGYHGYGFLWAWSNRFYRRTFFDEDRAPRDRPMQYLDLALFYHLPVSKYLTLKTQVAFRRGVDKNTGRFSYHQYKPTVEVQYKKKTLKIDVSVHYIHKDY